MNPLFEITLQDMVFGGDAIGHLPDGRAVFVPFGLPGETVRIVLVEEKSTFARGRIIEMLKPSPQRIKPLCPHFGTCGGCNYQHLDYAAQLELKHKIVKDQLQRLGGLSNFAVAPVVPSPVEWNYRNSLQFHLSRNSRLGFQQAGSNDLVEISECHLPLAGINALWPQLDFETGTGIERIQLREGIDGDLLMGLESPRETIPDFSVDFPISVVYQGPEAEFVLSGEDFTLMQVKDRTFRVSIGSFFQANTAQAQTMVDHVLHLAGSLKGRTVLDAYCGVGLFSAFMAGTAEKVVAIEVSESSCSDFAVNLDEFDNVELYIDQVENVLPTLAVKPDIVVVDPPRAGLEASVVSSLAAAQSGQIIYVSCDPATLSRDIKRFVQQGYELKSVTPFDQFPQTYHIECIAELRLTKA